MDYKIYTTAHDEIMRPLDLRTEDELKERAVHFHKLCPVEDFEPLRERLAQMKVPDEPTVVSLLIDNSGSMRGSKITFSIGAAGIISMYLDRLGIPNEILGFTTTSWRGGKPKDEWIDAERPQNPGRLNSLRHIVYKQIDERLEDVRHYLALMMYEGFLKENIDGESVLWAAARLRSYPQPHKILLVISDGAPVDDATLNVTYSSKEAGGLNYLEDHLRFVTNQIAEAGDIKLDAIGILHNVADYYGVGSQINQLEDLAPVAIAKLEQMLL